MTTTTNPLARTPQYQLSVLGSAIAGIDQVHELIEQLLGPDSALLTEAETLRILLNTFEEEQARRQEAGTVAFHTLADGALFTETADDDIPFVERSLLVKVPMFVGDYGETNVVDISLNDAVVDFDTEGVEENTRVRVVDDPHSLEQVRMLIDNEVNRITEQHDTAIQRLTKLGAALMRVQSTD